MKASRFYKGFFIEEEGYYKRAGILEIFYN